MVLNIGRRTIGIVVDSVNEVLCISQNQIAPAPPTVARLGNQYVTGPVRLEEQLSIPVLRESVQAWNPDVVRL